MSKLSEEDAEALARLYLLPEYKVLDIHIDNIILTLQNKYFEEATTLEEFKAVKLMRQGLLGIKRGVEYYHKMMLTRKSNAEDKKRRHEKWEQTPDHDDNLPLA